MKNIILVDGALYDTNKNRVYDYADYFADVEEAQRWVLENGGDEKVLDGSAE